MWRPRLVEWAFSSLVVEIVDVLRKGTSADSPRVERFFGTTDGRLLAQVMPLALIVGDDANIATEVLDTYDRLEAVITATLADAGIVLPGVAIRGVIDAYIPLEQMSAARRMQAERLFTGQAEAKED